MSEPWVTFVIPVLNEAAVIGALLRDLRQRYPGSQLIVVDGGSSDGSVEAALPLCDQVLADAGRVLCRKEMERVCTAIHTGQCANYAIKHGRIGEIKLVGEEISALLHRNLKRPFDELELSVPQGPTAVIILNASGLRIAHVEQM